MGVCRKGAMSVYTPVIIKYRDEKTEQAIGLEEWRH